MKLTLTKPIQFGTETITEFEFHEATAKDFRDLPLEPKIGDFLDVGAKLCGQTPAVMNMLCPVDMAEMLNIVGKSWTPGPKTGVTG